ncbi:MAG: hypothetical protein ACK56I_37605, partial [bacterium]
LTAGQRPAPDHEVGQGKGVGPQIAPRPAADRQRHLPADRLAGEGVAGGLHPYRLTVVVDLHAAGLARTVVGDDDPGPPVRLQRHVRRGPQRRGGAGMGHVKPDPVFV